MRMCVCVHVNVEQMRNSGVVTTATVLLFLQHADTFAIHITKIQHTH